MAIDEGHLEDLIERDRISRCITRSVRGMDRYDAELAKASFHPDGTDDHGTVIGSAHQYLDARKPGWPGLQHYVTNQSIDIEGDTAHAETYYLAVILHPSQDGGSEFTVGRYLDRLERRDGTWAIAHRQTILDWSGSMQPAREDSVIPDSAAFTKSAVDSTDASYVRPLVLDRPETR
jgi:hypothetical protein